MDEKFRRRFQSFENSLDSLAEARERDMNDSQRDKCKIQHYI